MELDVVNLSLKFCVCHKEILKTPEQKIEK